MDIKKQIYSNEFYVERICNNVVACGSYGVKYVYRENMDIRLGVWYRVFKKFPNTSV